MHVAILEKEKCHPKKCNHECRFYCPPVRSGIPTIEFPVENEQPVITESLCIGCGICVKRCPFDAIKIITLPDELNKEVFHQYGENQFRLYFYPTLNKGKVTSILGQNGTGKTTALNILSGITVPNFGKYEKPGDVDLVLEKFSNNIMGKYFKDLYGGKNKVILKNQYVDQIPKVVSGTIGSILKKTEENGKLDDMIQKLSLTNSLNKDVKECSGGELQKMAIAASVIREGDTYLFDETSSYLDVGERLKVAEIISSLAQEKNVMIVEHDLALMDWIAENVHIVYGTPGAYGVITEIRTSSRAINSFLSGFLREENIRIRPDEIKFESRSMHRYESGFEVTKWSKLTKEFNGFFLSVDEGKIHSGEIVGCLGRNALGKTTFARLLAGEMLPDSGEIDKNIKIAYKPQYISTNFDGTCQDMLMLALKEKFSDSFVKAEVFHPLGIDDIMLKNVPELSGGELQRLSIALNLAIDADLYLLDEPSAHLDSAYRMEAAKILKKVMERNRKSAIVIDHDIYFIDLVSDSLIVFNGEPGKFGQSEGPLPMKSGMNTFLKTVGITFRRDKTTNRPRINKVGSALDREQKATGNYYYEE